MVITVLLWTLAIILVVLGVVGTVIPNLPGPPLVLAALILAAWIDDFQHVGWPTLVLLGALTLLSLVVDFVATASGARRSGASALAVAGAIIGTLVGVVFGLAGILVGPFVGAVCGELLARRQLGRAVRAGVGTWLGLLFGTLAKLAIVCTMLAIFVLSYLL
jgi:uncharacterized protein YqgC (DUF456 family)